MHVFVLLLIQALLAHQRNTQAYAIIIKCTFFEILPAFSQQNITHNFIHFFNFVIMKVYLSSQEAKTYFIFWFITFGYQTYSMWTSVCIITAKVLVNRCCDILVLERLICWSWWLLISTSGDTQGQRALTTSPSLITKLNPGH